MKYSIPLAACLILTPPFAAAQQKIPNVGDQSCVLWTYMAEKSKSDTVWRVQVAQMDGWSMGYLKGMAVQYAYVSKGPNPLLKLRNNEEVDWMRSFCRGNQKSRISDAALALLGELTSRP